MLNGWGVGETHHGGYAGLPACRATGWCRMPENMTTADAMAIGTAGYTAMLCVMALEDEGVKPADGDVLVTGAAGGVGSIAIVISRSSASRSWPRPGGSRRPITSRSLGAATVIDRKEFDTPVKPLAKARWAAAVDAVGSVTLANVLSQTNPEGTVAACGLAQGMDLPTSVAPFILRGVKLIGVNSVTCPLAAPHRSLAPPRRAISILPNCAALSRHVKLDDVPRIAADIVAGKVRGRVVVDL